ncbi:hypothetical protein SAMN06298216_3689 [Spirosomataceae bacterium TFI 002]|nr:hypothetical protein SAMN06298216_3689 [Spirosomataceae bacterium TFI 002]
MFKKTWFKLLIGVIFLSAAIYSLVGSQQSYLERKTTERVTYEDNLRKMEDSPLAGSGKEPLKFYAIDEAWIVEAAFVSEEDGEASSSKSFSMMMTDSTFEKMDLAGKLIFEKNGEAHELLIFDEGESFLLPFTDLTSGRETYGGGRYINIPKDKLKKGRIKIDFNDAANFYCAFTPDFICPIPPKENMLNIGVAAGEKIFM